MEDVDQNKVLQTPVHQYQLELQASKLRACCSIHCTYSTVARSQLNLACALSGVHLRVHFIVVTNITDEKCYPI